MALQIGFGQYDVTPPLGVEMCGYDKRQGTASGRHDPLQARAVVFTDGHQATALVVADVITILPAQYARVGQRVEQWTGIPRAHVVAAGTHTHSGATPHGRPARGGRPSPNQLYAALLPELMASAVKLAWDDRRSAALAGATVTVPAQTINRREPGGTVAPELTVVHVRRRGAPDGLLLNFACHGVVLGPDNLALSGDWIGLTRAAVEAEAPGLFPLVAVAPSGDVNPLPASLRRQLRGRGTAVFTNDPFSGIYDRTGGTFAEAAAMARTLAGAALAALSGAQRLAPAGGVGAISRRANIGAGPRRIPVLLRVLRAGELGIAGMAGEQFVETGQRAREVLQARGLMPIILCHAPHLTYVPTPAAFAQQLAQDYEVDLARKLGMAPDAAEREIVALERAVQRLVA